MYAIMGETKIQATTTKPSAVKLYGDGMGWEERGRDVMGWAWGGEGRGEEERRGEGPR